MRRVASGGGLFGRVALFALVALAALAALEACAPEFTVATGSGGGSSSSSSGGLPPVCDANTTTACPLFLPEEDLKFTDTACLAVGPESVFFTTGIQAAGSSGGGSVGLVERAGGGLNVFAKGEGDPVGIATDGVTVFWAARADGKIRSYTVLSGTLATPVANEPMPTWVALGLAGSTPGIYWTTGTSPKAADPGPIWVYTPEGGVVAFQSEASAVDIKADDTGVFWTDSVKRGVFTASAPAPVTTVATGSSVTASVTGIALANSSVYWANADANDNGSVWSISQMTKTMKNVAMGLGGSPSHVAADGHGVYWTEPGAGHIDIQLNGQAHFSGASGMTNLGCIAADGTYVFWIASNTVWRMVP